MEKKAEGVVGADSLYKVPTIEAPTTDRIFADLKGVNEQVAVLSYLPCGDLIRLAKTGRAGFQFISDTKTRKKIMCWKPDDAMANRLNSYLTNIVRMISALNPKA